VETYYFLNAFGVNFGEGYEGFLSIMVGGEEYRPFAGPYLH
jgi:hypothetical protein